MSASDAAERRIRHYENDEPVQVEPARLSASVTSSSGDLSTWIPEDGPPLGDAVVRIVLLELWPFKETQVLNSFGELGWIRRRHPGNVISAPS